MHAHASQTVTEFLTAFFSGDVGRAKELVSRDFSYEAPFGSGDSRSYFAGAETKATFIRSFRILHQWEDGDDVSTIFELAIATDDGEATMPMSEWHRVRDGKIVSTLMIFNGSAKAVELLSSALRQHA